MRMWAMLGTVGLGGALVSLTLSIPAQNTVAGAGQDQGYLYGPAHRATSAAAESSWAGYIATGAAPYKTVTADWIEPEATCSPSENSAAAFWVGLDGYLNAGGSNTVEQVGSTVGCIDGTPVHNAFVEFFPNPPIPIIAPISENDSFTGTSTWNGGDSYTETITDTTEGWTKTITGTQPGATNTTAEVIAEAPTVNSQLPLTNFGAVPFTSCMVDGQPIGADPDVAHTSVVGASGLVDALPTPLTDNMDFAAVWENTD